MTEKRSVFDMTVRELAEIEAVMGVPVGNLFKAGPVSVATLRGEAWLVAKDADPDLTVEKFLEGIDDVQPWRAMVARNSQDSDADADDGQDSDADDG